jgi:hypothetical protein
MAAGEGWTVDMLNLLAKMVAQVFVRQGHAVKGSDSIGPIGGRQAVQIALCKMHDLAGCTKRSSRHHRKPLNLKDFLLNQFLARSLQPSTHVCHTTVRS